MLEWLSMGGYAPFVWGSYAIAIGGLAALTLWAWRAHTRARQAAAGLKPSPLEN
jgi:heme exporter protein CcmD